jgi:HK97 family phage major capsid protein
MSQKRDELTSEFNKLAARAAELRGTENADELITVTAKMRSIESELSVIDRQEGVAKVEVVSTPAATLGEEAIESRVFTKPIGSVVELEKRDIFNSNSQTGNSSAYIGLDTTPGIAALPTLATTFVDLLPVVPTSSDVVRYFRQETFSNAAAGTGAQLSALNKSDLSWSPQIAVLAKVGHYMIVAKETLADDPAVAALINREGVRGVREKIEADLLAASNVSGSITSILAGAQDETYTAAEGVLVGIRQAKTKAEIAGLPADFVVVSPVVREAIDLLAIPDNGGVGYFASGPSTVFGMRLVTSYRLPAGVDALVGSTQAVTLRSKSGVTVETSDSHDDYFIKDGVAIKVTAQIAAQNVRPSAFVKVSAAA